MTELRDQGHEAIAASPNSGVNTVTGEELAEALKGAAGVVDVTNAPSWEDAEVMKFFETSTHNLLKHGADAGVKNLVALSVLGTEQPLLPGEEARLGETRFETWFAQSAGKAAAGTH